MSKTVSSAIQLFDAISNPKTLFTLEFIIRKSHFFFIVFWEYLRLFVILS